MSELTHPTVLAAIPVARAFDALGVNYFVGGSLASSTFGVSRSTVDADIVADLKIEHVARFCEILGDDYYADPEWITDATRRRMSFNVIYVPLMHKVDIFFVSNLFERNMMRRMRRCRVEPNNPESDLPLASPEDIILHKLLWYRQGGCVSERQWIDVLNVLKVQAGRLEEDYMDQWAGDLELTDLLAKARGAAKL